MTESTQPASSPPESQFLPNADPNAASTSSAAPNGTDTATLANGTTTSDHIDAEAGPSTATRAEAPDLNVLFAQRREEEQARRDRSLAEFLLMLDGYKPLIPEEVTEYYLQRAGFECSDPRLKRLLSLSAQKFVSDLARDAFHFAKLRVNGQMQGRGRPHTSADKNRVVLTMEDLSLALAEHGVNVKKPDYYI